MKTFNLAIEKGKRYLKDNNILSFYFIATEFIFKKEDIVSGNYHFEFKNNNNVFFKQKLTININNKKVFVENSHEDPLTESDSHFFICGQLTQDLIKPHYENIDCLFYYENNLIRKQSLSAKQIKALFLLHNWNSQVHDKHIISTEDCIIRVHLGKSNATYEEEDYLLEKGQTFDFSKYLLNYEYVAVQCSYEEDFDIEEKHVLKGIKGIWNSHYYFDKEFYIPMIPFSQQYTDTLTTGWLDINSIKELLDYYKANPEDINKTFEMDDKFLVTFYKLHKTSAIGNIYSSKMSKIFHIDSDLCEQCNTRSKCMQLVPSGMSELLFKKNLMVENFKNCSINKIIKNKE